MRRIADFVSAVYQVRTGSHGPSRFVTSLHGCGTSFLICWVPNFGVQVRIRLFRTNAQSITAQLDFDDGLYHAGTKPGLGIEFDEKLAAMSYEPAYLPVARLEDGALWNW